MTSQIGQDDFIIRALNGKKNGTFVDIGCFHPIEINNTVVLERDYGWTGINIDIFTEGGKEGEEWEFGNTKMSKTFSEWAVHRPESVVIKEDALTIDYSALFKEHKLPKTIDYLSIDLEPPKTTFDVFKLLPLNEYKFNTITYEHDGYRMGIDFTLKTRKYITSFGYVLTENSYNQDDFYIHRDLVKPEDLRAPV
jgi:hypothetical protein